MKQCRKNGLSMEAVIRANEEVIRSHEVIDDTLDHIWSVMRSLCVAVWWWNPLVWAAAAESK